MVVDNRALASLHGIAEVALADLRAWHDWIRQQARDGNNPLLADAEHALAELAARVRAVLDSRR